MPKALQCPSCGQVHPMTIPEIAGGGATFRCNGCSRLLSVPSRVGVAEGAPAAAGAQEPTVAIAPAAPAAAGTALAAAAASPAAASRQAAGDPAPPERPAHALPGVVRAFVWIVALGLGLAVAAFSLRQLGVLDVDQAIDVFAGTGLGRFAVLLVLLPLWAVLSGTLAHFTIEALSRARRPRAASHGSP